MNVVEHVGITLAAVLIADQTVHLISKKPRARVTRAPFQTQASDPANWAPSVYSPDYRTLIVGSVLPDLVDKPLVWLASDLVNNSLRSVGHAWPLPAMLFFLAFTAKPIRRPLLWLGIGSVAHLILDQMWTLPGILAWPLLGWTFPRGSTSVEVWWDFQLRRFDFGLPELAVGVLLLAIGLRLFYRGKLVRFFRSGSL